jgi:outer membrane immunogenic protein
VVSGTGSVRDASDDLNGAVYGAHLGYNIQYGAIVFGAEVGINGAALEAAPFRAEESSAAEIRHEVDWYASAVGRLGYAHDDFLVYGFGGIAWTKVQTDFPSTSNFTVDKDETAFAGWTAGIGIEYALNDRFSLRFEYAHVDLGSEENFRRRQAITPNVDLVVTNDTDIQFDVLRVGASYRLGGGDETLK